MVLKVRASVWRKTIVAGRGASCRVFKTLAQCRQWAVEHGYAGIVVKFTA